MQNYRPSPFAAFGIIFLMVMILAFIVWLTIKVDVWGLALQFALMA